VPIEVILGHGSGSLETADASGRVRHGGYSPGLAVWTLVGVAVYTLYRVARIIRRRRDCDRSRCLRVHAAQRIL